MSGSVRGEFDYVVVGGGSAGCVLATRLSEDPGLRVLLLESGSGEAHPLMANPPVWPGLWGTAVDYGYLTEPQEGLNGAAMSWPRGHALGGSSAINGMVYLRGHHNDYDSWVKEHGAEGWSFEEVLPYLRRSESVAGADPNLRGQHGPMRPSRARTPNPLSEVFLAAASAAGFPLSSDLNGAQAEGAGWNDLAIVDGRRQSVADAYLRPVLARPNLTVATDSRATRLLLDGDRCVGVGYQRGGEVLEARADREVVLSAGTIDSPRLLLLSGIGPADELRDAGVPVHHDLPGVGRNLHDHPSVTVIYQARQPLVPGVNNLAEASLSWRSDPSRGGPDMQMLCVHVPYHLPSLQAPADSFSFLVTTVPDSRGSIRLRTADPAAPPLIDPRCYAEDSDLTRMVDGLGVARDIARQAPFDPWRGAEVLPGAAATTRDELVGYLRRATGSYFHPVGTCAMGTGPDAVVTPELRVRGLRNLRVADASIMPKVLSVNTNVAATMIGERAADLLVAEPSRSPR